MDLEEIVKEKEDNIEESIEQKSKEIEKEIETEKLNRIENLKCQIALENIEKLQVEKRILTLNIDQNFEIFENILIKLIKLISISLKENDLLADELKMDKDLFIIKFCSDNNYIDLESFYTKCYPELLRILINSKRFGLMANDNIRLCTQKNLRFLKTKERIEILFYLVNSAFDLSLIKQQIKYEIDCRNELLRERTTLDYEL